MTVPPKRPAVRSFFSPVELSINTLTSAAEHGITSYLKREWKVVGSNPCWKVKVTRSSEHTGEKVEIIIFTVTATMKCIRFQDMYMSSNGHFLSRWKVASWQAVLGRNGWGERASLISHQATGCSWSRYPLGHPKLFNLRKLDDFQINSLTLLLIFFLINLIYIFIAF